MKFKTLVPVLVLALASFGFKNGDSVEFHQALNGRADSDVRRTAKNIRFTVAKGTRARIQRVKEFRSGNYSLEVELTSGPRKGEKVWVYYNLKNPGLRLYKPDPRQMLQTTRDVRRATTAQAIRDVATFQSPIDQELQPATESEELVRAVRAFGSVENGIHQVSRTEIPCDPSSFVPGPYPESSSSAISVDEYSGEIPYPTCGTRMPEGYNFCVENGKVTSFNFQNTGPNAINPNSRNEALGDRYRDFRFDFPKGARQEMGLEIVDFEPAVVHKSHVSFMRIFPRRVTPSIRVQNGVYHVTLTTGEIVRFKADTREIIGGVLEEGPMRFGSPASVNYTGAGVVVRSDSAWDAPETGTRTATITKPQCGPAEKCKPCRVPVSKLWTDNPDDPRFRFPTDQGFDRFLRKTCGFGI